MSVTTAVRGVFSAAHRDPLNGAMHGHDYEVIAHFGGEPLRRFEVLQETLRQTLSGFVDHVELPPDRWSAEALAPLIGGLLGGCIRLEINRPWLGHFVVWTP